MTTTIPRQVVNARRAAGAILLVATLGTVIMLVLLVASWSTRPPTVATTGTNVATHTLHRHPR